MAEAKVRVSFLDTTLRDGAQSLPLSNQFSDRAKPDIARSIGTLGVTTIEAGFPATPMDRERVSEVANTAGRAMVARSVWGRQGVASELEAPRIAGLSRANRNDVIALLGRQ